MDLCGYFDIPTNNLVLLPVHNAYRYTFLLSSNKNDMNFLWIPSSFVVSQPSKLHEVLVLCFCYENNFEIKLIS